MVTAQRGQGDPGQPSCASRLTASVRSHLSSIHRSTRSCPRSPDLRTRTLALTSEGFCLIANYLNLFILKTDQRGIYPSPASGLLPRLLKQSGLGLVEAGSLETLSGSPMWEPPEEGKGTLKLA